MPRTREGAVAQAFVLMVVLAGKAPPLMYLLSSSSCLSLPLQGLPCEKYLTMLSVVAAPTTPGVEMPMPMPQVKRPWRQNC